MRKNRWTLHCDGGGAGPVRYVGVAPGIRASNLLRGGVNFDPRINEVTRNHYFKINGNSACTGGKLHLNAL
tara:strand:- start:178203 stop:178415 length:213 start_codon:yes stop_codon:yes gene_type:complete